MENLNEIAKVAEQNEMDSRNIYKEEWISLRSVREGQVRFILELDQWVLTLFAVQEADLAKEERIWISMDTCSVQCPKDISTTEAANSSAFENVDIKFRKKGLA